MRWELLEPGTCGGLRGWYLTEHVHLLSRKLSLEGFWHQVIQTAHACLWSLFVLQLDEGRRRKLNKSHWSSGIISIYLCSLSSSHFCHFKSYTYLALQLWSLFGMLSFQSLWENWVQRRHRCFPTSFFIFPLKWVINQQLPSSFSYILSFIYKIHSFNPVD